MTVDIHHPDFMKNHLDLESKLAFLSCAEQLHLAFDGEAGKWTVTLDDGTEFTSELDLTPAIDEAVDYANKSLDEFIEQLHKEDGRYLKREGSVWCRNCECFVHPSEMRISLSDDDITTKKLCDGCDTVLLEIKSEREQ